MLDCNCIYLSILNNDIMTFNSKLHALLLAHITDHLRTFNTDKFVWNDFYPPNTTATITDSCVSLLATMNPHTCSLYMKIVNELTRSTDPALAVTVHLSYDKLGMSRSSYFKSLKELKDYRLILPTPKKGMYIVNVQFFNKIYNSSKSLK